MQLAAVFALLIVVVVLLYLTNAPSSAANQDYWTLSISASGGHVHPNGTIQVPMNETGVTVTTWASGWNIFTNWLLDGTQTDGTTLDNDTRTIFVPQQQVNSTHTLEAHYYMSTPPMNLIVNHQAEHNLTIDAGVYQAYNFTMPDVFTQNSVIVNVKVLGSNESEIKVYLLSSVDFNNWQRAMGTNGTGSGVFSGEGNTVDCTVSVSSGGTYYLVLDNTFDLEATKMVDCLAVFWYVPP